MLTDVLLFRFRSITRSFYRLIECCLLCYALDDPDSLGVVKEWYQNLRAHEVERPPIPVILMGLKSDLPRVVSREQGKSLAAELGVPFMEGSAKENRNIRRACNFLIDRAWKIRIASGNSAAPGRYLPPQPPPPPTGFANDIAREVTRLWNRFTSLFTSTDTEAV